MLVTILLLRYRKLRSIYEMPEIDLVIVDLYPFEDTVKSTDDEDAIIEKIDIGGIALIRGAAKNFNDVVIVPSKNEYPMIQKILAEERIHISKESSSVS